MYDTKLVVAAQEGDEAAFAALYDRNAEAVYDFCWALTGDEAEASRMVEDAFVLAARHIDEITDASQIRPWLLSIARDRALVDDEAGSLHTAWGTRPAVGGAAEVLGNGDLRRWAREAAATLALADQAVLELTTRHELEGDQLASAIGCEPSQLETVVVQVDHEAEEVLGALVVARQGRKDCPELAELLAGWDGAPSVDVAEQAATHAATCERCSRRLAVAEPLRLVAAAPPAPLPPGLRATVLDRVGPEVAAAGARRAPGEPAPAAAALAAAAFDVAVVAAGVAAEGPGPEGRGRSAGPVGPVSDATVMVVPAPDVGVVDPVAPPPGPPSAGGTGDKDQEGPPWLIIAAAGLAVAVLIAIVALAVRPSPKSNVSTTTPTTVASTAAPDTTLAPSTSAVAPETLAPVVSSTTTSTAAPSSGHLQLDTTSVDLGATGGSAQVLLSNSGSGPVTWKVSVGTPWLTAAPSQGTLAANGSVSVAFTIDRNAAPAGTFSVQVAFIATGTGNVGAVLTVNGSQPPPTTTSSTSTTSAVGPQISALTGTAVGHCQATISATVTDVVPVSSVLVSYTLPNGTHGSAAMSKSGAVWSVVVTGWATGGSLTFSVTATDTGATSQTSPTAAVTVPVCP